MKLSKTEIAKACEENISTKSINNNVYGIHVWSDFYLDNHTFDMGDNGLTIFKSIVQDIVNGNAVKLGMGDDNGNTISISMNTDVLDFENVKIIINNDNTSLVPADKLIEAVDKSIFHQERNREILATLLTERKFSIVEKGTGSSMYGNRDGWSEYVAASDSCEDCNYYSMLLVGEPTVGGSWDVDENGIYPHSENDPDLTDIKARWIPLPILAEMLCLKKDFGFQNDNAHNPVYHKTADILELIAKAIN